MSTATSTPASSAAERALPVRKRGDLSVHPLWFSGRRYWGIKDPVSLRYFQLREEEYFVLQMLNGRSSLEQIRVAFEERFSPRRLSIPQLQSFLGILHQQGLVIAGMPGQGTELFERHAKAQRRKLLAAVSNVLAIRFRGIDPDPLLRWLYPEVKWVFSRWFAAFALLIIFSALGLLAVQYRTLEARLPDFQSFFSPENLVWLAVAMAVTKVLHELGHAISCKHYGGECHELGLMLLAFTPCLYVNVSDAWMLPNKWHRIAISAAGILVELFIAAVCTFLWWFSEPGLLNGLCLNTMLVCSVSTLIFNGNPLLRYDGYYIFADLMEIPNLSQQASGLWKQWLSKWFLGIDYKHARMLPDRLIGLIAVYGAAALIYRWFVMFAILWVCHHILKPYGLQALVHLIAASTLVGLVVVPAWQLTRYLGDPLRSRQIMWNRLLVRGALAAVVAVAALLIRWPYHVKVPAVLEPAGARRVYVSVAGKLRETIEEGTAVARGQQLASLENYELRGEIVRLEGEQAQLELALENLERRRVRDPEVESQIPATRERLADVTERLARRREDEAKLILKAPASGEVLAPPSLPKPGRKGELRLWAGTPLQKRNLGAFLDVGTLFCLIGDARQLEAVLVIDQTDVEFVKAGQQVEFLIHEHPGAFLSGTIVEIAAIDLKIAPRDMLEHEGLSYRKDSTGTARLQSTKYQARVKLDPFDAALPIGSTGTGKISVAPQSLAQRVLRYLSRTFHFEL